MGHARGMTGASEWQGGGGQGQTPQSSPGRYDWSWGQESSGGQQPARPSNGDGPDWVNFGIVGGVVIIVGLLAGIGWLLMSDSGDDGQTTTVNEQSDQTTTTGAGPEDTTTPPPTGSTDLTPVLALEVGDCFTEPETDDSDRVVSIPTVDCAESHEYEVYARFDLEDDVWRGADQVEQDAEDGCGSRFEEFVGIALVDSELEVLHLTPTIESWEQNGDRTVKCILQDPSGPVTGSLEDAAR